jgi:hypothetical protein
MDNPQWTQINGRLLVSGSPLTEVDRLLMVRFVYDFRVRQAVNEPLVNLGWRTHQEEWV